jgi:sugar lactone lactonase YvrE
VPTYEEVARFGGSGSGSGDGQFLGNAFGLATDKGGRIYVADSDNLRIQIFSPTGAFQAKIVPAARTPVNDVAVDAAGNVWATTDTNAEALQFTPGGAPLATVTTPKGAIGIGADTHGNIYVSTNGDNIQEVVRYDKSGAEYEEELTWGGFQAPSDVEVCADDTVWVADHTRLDVRRFDGSSGRLLKTIKGGLSAPIGIGVDPDCNVWMTNIAQRRIDLYSPEGKLLARAAADDLIAQDVVVAPSGDLYAFDSGSQRIVRLAPASGAAGTPTGTPTGTVLVDGAPLTAGTVPYGSTVDVTKGSLVLETEAGTLKVYGAGGVPAAFKLVRTKEKNSTVVELRLVKGDFSACPKRKTRSAQAAPAKPVRALWGSGKGKFRTRGRYAAATVRGTKWLTTDRCDGTQVRVTQGTMAVSDLAKRKQVVVRAGKSYLARP